MTFNPANGSSEFSRYCIIPKHSEISSRKLVDISFRDYKIPIISANMTSVTGSEMVTAMVAHGGIACLPRFHETKIDIDLINKINSPNVWASVGVTDSELERAHQLINHSKVSRIVIDVAHADSLHTLKQVEVIQRIIWQYQSQVKGLFGNLSVPDVSLTVGNIVSADAVDKFIKLGVKSFKIGIGSGLACTTRVKTGVGYPQLLAVSEIRKKCGPDIELISDGGHQTPGDIAKSLAAGANLVMIGSMLAKTQESAGKGQYYGSASARSYVEQNKLDHWRTAEGTETSFEVSTTVAEVLQDISGGLRSAFSYVGALNMQEFHEKAVLFDTLLNKPIVS